MLEDSEKIALLKLARMTLEANLNKQPSPECTISQGSLVAYKGAFVSLHRRDELRGCIGQLYPDRELYKTVQHCVLSAALEDTRFLPVTLAELKELDIEISVLTPFHRIESVEEIEVGKHGLYIVQGHFRGLLLPQVATQYQWDRTTFLEQTCRKSGLPQSAWKDPRTAIHIFEAEVFSESDFPVE
jgi:AmmeMemoRadiSam system protein A